MSKPKPPRPTEHDTKMIRLLAQRGGRMLVTQTADRTFFATPDGYTFDAGMVRRWIAAGWVKPGDQPLFGELAQSYVLKTVLR